MYYEGNSDFSSIHDKVYAQKSWKRTCPGFDSVMPMFYNASKILRRGCYRGNHNIFVNILRYCETFDEKFDENTEPKGIWYVTWDKVFKNRQSKISWKQPIENL